MPVEGAQIPAKPSNIEQGQAQQAAAAVP